MNKSDFHRLASMLEDEACDLRVLAEDGLLGHHKRILGRSSAQLDNIAFTIRLMTQAIGAEDSFDPSKAITDPFK